MILRARLVGLQILLETFQFQILLRNISGGESESLWETVWLLDWILFPK
jgi:hypothetical protein